MIQRELGEEAHLARERRALPSLLASDEELLAVASAGFGVVSAGILAITDGRLIFLSFRYFFLRRKVTEIGFGQIETVESESWRSSAELRVRLRKGRHVIHVPIMAGVERAAELATCARKAVARFDFHADQAARELGTRGS